MAFVNQKNPDWNSRFESGGAIAHNVRRKASVLVYEKVFKTVIED